MIKYLQRILMTLVLTMFASHASAMFIQPDWFDPTQPGVGTNRYAYSANDPINRMDPLGNASCGENLSGGECDYMLDRADDARDGFENIKDRVDTWVNRLEEGSEVFLDEEDEKLAKRLRLHFGDDVISAENLTKISETLGTMADRIGPRGDGVVIRKVDEYRGASPTREKGFTAQAHPRRNLITVTKLFSERLERYLDKAYGPGFADRYVSRVLGHEVGHPALNLGPRMPNGTGDIAYGLKGVRELGAGLITGNPYRNIDSFVCSALECH